MVSTAFKIAAARRIASLLFAAGIAPRRKATRRGVTFELDLREGIDLSLFLFGRFQGHVLQLIERFVPADGLVIDVGANIGAIALPVASMLPRGHVYAIEPTDYAFAKLTRNIELNPSLAPRITTIRSFVADVSRAQSELVAYSSWPVAGEEANDAHPVHRGIPKPASCGQITLDELTRGFPAVSLIKVDTDGHEYTVLRGAANVLARFQPVIVFEACAYLMQPPSATFADFESLLREHGYTIRDARTLRPLSGDEFTRKCPVRGGMDLVATPQRFA